MGQKVNPHGARVGVIMDWSTKWYAGKKDFSNNLIEDYNIRKLVPKLIDDFGKQRGGAVKEKRDFRGANPSISRIDVHRAGTKLHITVYTAKPGVVIGQGGQGVEFLKKGLEDYTGRQVQLDIMEIKNPDCDAQLVADSIAEQLERRISFRRAMKQAISRSMKAGAKGIKTACSGRLGGADIARSEGYHEGSIPLQTLRANI
ncbi:MAG: 30S ribosomal protein S3, partial [Clostridia bacterium]|nr:30S ribosomal protein S3 [Clostridia bacterium]